MTVRILVGDATDRLSELPDESVHMVCTSPPYYGLRDYGVAGQLGLEATPDEYIARMVRHDNRPENLELWTSRQPRGQRVADLVEWAKEILTLYGEADP